jgi:hypothetical protein
MFISFCFQRHFKKYQTKDTAGALKLKELLIWCFLMSLEKSFIRGICI